MFAVKYFAPLALSVSMATAGPTPNSVRAASASTTSGSVYAYGSGINGLPLWYGNGMAYLGPSQPANMTNAANITLSVSDSTVTAQPRAYNGTTSALEESILYIDTTEGSFAHVGFTDNSTVSSDATTTTGFSYFGTMLTWEDADGDIESSWYAELLDGESKIWKLMWNTDVDIDTDTVIPVVLKNKAPTSD